MKSRIYDCEVFHARSAPSKHQFRYRYFTFCLDLDEIVELSRKSRLLGEGSGKLFRFQAKDFIFAEGKSGKLGANDLKASVCDYARENGVSTPILRVELVAHMRTLGYAFNPAAFYFCYDASDQPVCAILEVTNTYREKKAYFLGPESWNSKAFRSSQSKLFYVSPFVDRDSKFEMALAPPGEVLRLQIDSTRSEVLEVHSLVVGRKAALSDLALFRRFLAQPAIALGVMAKIHYQAFRLYFKKVPYFKKEH